MTHQVNWICYTINGAQERGCLINQRKISLAGGSNGNGMSHKIRREHCRVAIQRHF
jgi:hypothetical protein